MIGLVHDRLAFLQERTPSSHTMRRSYLVAIMAVVALVGVLLLPISVPLSIVVPGKILPAREWTLIRDQEGSIGAILRDHALGVVQSYTFNRFERGDVIRLTLHPAIRPHLYVEAGDTLASIFSSETQRQLAQLTGELSTILASLDLYATGEKASIVEEARTQLASAEERALQNHRVLARLRTLREQALIAEQDLEVAESQQRVLEADIAAARARLDVVQTGAKPQQLDLTRTEAAALRDEIATLNDRMNLFTITAPISGMIVRSFGNDTLLQMIDMTQYVVVMPVPWSTHRDLVLEQAVDVEVFGISTPVKGRLQQLGDVIHLINGQQVMLVTASIDDAMDMPPGAMARCTIANGSVPLRQYLRRMAQSVFQ